MQNKGELQEDDPYQDVLEAMDELRALKEKGVLFSPASQPDQVRYSGEIKSMCLNISQVQPPLQYCFAKEGTYGGRAMDMSEEIARKAIDFLIAHSGARRNLEVDFFGGEPLLNFDVVKSTVHYAREQAQKAGKTFRFTITTNGVIDDEDKLDFINQNMSNVVINIDGREEVHNYHRAFKADKAATKRRLNLPGTSGASGERASITSAALTPRITWTLARTFWT